LNLTIIIGTVPISPAIAGEDFKVGVVNERCAIAETVDMASQTIVGSLLTPAAHLQEHLDPTISCLFSCLRCVLGFFLAVHLIDEYCQYVCLRDIIGYTLSFEMANFWQELGLFSSRNGPFVYRTSGMYTKADALFT